MKTSDEPALIVHNIASLAWIALASRASTQAATMVMEKVAGNQASREAVVSGMGGRRQEGLRGISRADARPYTKAPNQTMASACASQRSSGAVEFSPRLSTRTAA